MERWRLTWRGRWRQKEHINVQELRVIGGICPRLSLQRRAWRRRVLIFSDSLVALGCVMQGGSGSFPLWRQCRILCALSLGLQIRPLVRWIESKRNWSDGPSRGLGVGAAEETVAIHASRAQERSRRSAGVSP